MLLVIRKQSEAAAMTRWGVRIAKARQQLLHILWVEPGGERGGSEVKWLEWGADEELADSPWQALAGELNRVEELDIRLCRLRCASRHLAVLAVERQLSPDLLVVGRHDSAKDGSMTGKLARELMDAALSPVLVLRLGEVAEGGGLDGAMPDKILVPCAGGRHSRLGMRLASALAGKDATMLYIQSETDELSEEVGREHLRRSLKRAGVAEDSVSPRVVLADEVADGIACELLRGEYGLMLIGASDGGSLRRKLFGTVPERLVRGAEGVSIGVIRGARPVAHRFGERMGRLMSLSIPQLKRGERIQLFAEVEGKARWSFDFAVLMVLATAIAGLGLLADSGAVVIGAMLVAPLMTPLLGGGLAVVQGNWPLWKACQKSVLLGFLSALLIGLLLGLLARGLGLGLTSELLARGEPTLLDLGVAFISGVAASYCLARPKLSGALAGVAIAAALVPPIATTGICLALEEGQVAKGAALLFGTNVVAIVLGSAMNFLMAGVKGARQAASRVWARRLSIVLALICAGLAVPLASVLLGKAGGGDTLREEVEGVLQGSRFRLTRVQTLREAEGRRVLEIRLEGPEMPAEAVTDRLRALALERYQKTGEKVPEIRIRLDWVKEL